MSRLLFLALPFALLAAGCSGAAGGNDPVVGSTLVDLDLSKKTVRSGEAPVGNLVADAYLEAGRVLDPTVQIALVNGGSLRCPSELDELDCDGYVIEPGDITEAMLVIVMPFETKLVIKDVPGATLRSTLERSVSSLPTETKGWFLHVAGLTYDADCAQVAQAIDPAMTAVLAEGQRVTQTVFEGLPIVDTQTYRVVTNAYVGSGQDGHVLLADAPLIIGSEGSDRDALRDHLAQHSPVSPAVEGRIGLTPACAVP